MFDRPGTTTHGVTPAGSASRQFMVARRSRAKPGREIGRGSSGQLAMIIAVVALKLRHHGTCALLRAVRPSRVVSYGTG
ncbi:hypothetical protein NITHO_2550002 [Nitrolancea hollandica Lb]|uniref:Uncharacterized protein n=1 Tax=Nitrolancea hollandica Lb TaxID=1129897 RepID=I4EG54_9BACT|nr:hypothetical protein NITHO_2550002 [Nitrolancea hollandica Lb]